MRVIRQRMMELDFKEEFVEKILKDFSPRKIEEKLDLLMERRNIQSPAGWLMAALIRNGLIAGGEVDERSILDVSADDLIGFTQCHFFAGIGGWSYALRLSGFPDD